MYPVGSNGASQAILDARCLADQLAQREAVEALWAYEAERLPKTSEIIRSNRLGGPERMLDLVAQRAPQGFQQLTDVIAWQELAEIAGGYAHMTGMGSPPRS
jgi:2-polyprenyl-6-methoxyphenol hydroxylase-like FAD-dependent oxidoreductase